ncbi:MAG: RIP metalloprotease RseP [bacterium]
MEVLTNIFYFAVTIGVLVFVHELGHFLAAKFFKMRVERFSVGFPPRAFGKTIGDTDYCVSWVPIGGYVKISGMIDESFDTEFVGKPPEPWEFRSKPIWQRMIVICAGVVMNVLLAIVIFWGIIFSHGKTVKPITEVGFVEQGSPAASAGFQSGDLVLAVNSNPVLTWEDVDDLVFKEALSGTLAVEVQRAGAPATIAVPDSLTAEILKGRLGIYPNGLLPTVSVVEKGKPAEQIGLQPNDLIEAVNDQPVAYQSLSSTIKKFANTEIKLRWKRGEETRESLVTPTPEGKIGIAIVPHYSGPTQKINYGLFEALPHGITSAWEMSWLNVKSLVQIFSGRVSFKESVGGPVMIAQMATRSAEVGIVSFLGFVALLSMNLAFLNLLPFPALDGGHFMFLLVEGVFRREIPVKIKIAIQQVGVVLLLVFMAFVLYNDIIKF